MIQCNIQIKEIDQEKADNVMKELKEANFEKAFDSERSRKDRNDKVWALPTKERLYYIALIDGIDVLLAGINNHFNISSFAKISLDDKHRKKGRYCIKKLIEDILITENKHIGKGYIYININSNEGKRVLDYLMTHLPKGIEKIESTMSGFRLKLY